MQFERRTSGDYELNVQPNLGDYCTDPQSTIAAFKAKNGYESATSGIEKQR